MYVGRSVIYCVQHTVFQVLQDTSKTPHTPAYLCRHNGFPPLGSHDPECLVILEAPDERVFCPLVDTDGVPAAAGRGWVAGAQVLGGKAALVADDMVVLELLGSSTKALLKSTQSVSGKGSDEALRVVLALQFTYIDRVADRPGGNTSLAAVAG